MIGLEELELLHFSICQAVGDTKRIQILYALHEQPRHVSALAELLNTPQPTISRHLALLRDRGLVIAERSGSTVVYRLTDPRIIEAIEIMRTVLRDSLIRRASVFEKSVST
jgi:ArsR family transcriptional regulator